MNENADPTAASDLIEAFAHIIPPSVPNAAALRLSLIRRGVVLPIVNGKPQLGTWQGIHAMAVDSGATSRSRSRSKSKSGSSSGTIHELSILYTYVRSEIPPVLTTETAPSRGCHVISPPGFASSSKSRSDVGMIGFGFCKHTSASLAWNAMDPLLGDSMEKSLNALVPEKWNEEFFEHTYEGPDDMPGHVKSTLMGAGVTFPLASTQKSRHAGHVYLCEHRNTGGWGGGHNRKIVWLGVTASASSHASIPVNERGMVDISGEIEAAAAEVKIKDGLIHVSVLTGEGIVVSSSVDTTRELRSHLSTIVPQSKSQLEVIHTVLGQSCFLPLRKGKLVVAEEGTETLKVVLMRERAGGSDTCDTRKLLLHMFAS